MEETAARNEFERGVGRAYNREFWPAMAAYLVVTMAISFLVDFETAGWWKYPVAMIPVIPVAWAVRAVGRHLNRIDEMQRNTLLEAIAVGFGGAMLAAVTLGFLAMSGLETGEWGSWVIFAAGMGSWGLFGCRQALVTR